jgi:hypothetical protein
MGFLDPKHSRSIAETLILVTNKTFACLTTYVANDFTCCKNYVASLESFFVEFPSINLSFLFVILFTTHKIGIRKKTHADTLSQDEYQPIFGNFPYLQHTVFGYGFFSFLPLLALYYYFFFLTPQTFYQCHFFENTWTSSRKWRRLFDQHNIWILQLCIYAHVWWNCGKCMLPHKCDSEFSNRLDRRVSSLSTCNPNNHPTTSLPGCSS